MTRCAVILEKTQHGILLFPDALKLFSLLKLVSWLSSPWSHSFGTFCSFLRTCVAHEGWMHVRTVVWCETRLLQVTIHKRYALSPKQFTYRSLTADLSIRSGKARTIWKNQIESNHIFTSMKINNGTISPSPQVILPKVNCLLNGLQAT